MWDYGRDGSRMSLNRQNEVTAEFIAQLVVAGLARPKIARALDMTYVALDCIMTTPEYQF